MKKTAIALAVVLAVSACIPPIGFLRRTPPDDVIKQADGSWLITAGTGGDVGGHLEFRAMLERDGNPVVIDGTCDSACTVFYSLPKACLTARARMGFHKASGLGTDIWERAIAQHYRAGVRDKYQSEWSGRESVSPRLDRAEMRALDPETVFCGE